MKKTIEAYIKRDFSFFRIFDVSIAEAFMRYNMFQDFHKWAYDFESLSHMLKDCGFYKIYEYSYRAGKMSRFRENRAERATRKNFVCGSCKIICA